MLGAIGIQPGRERRLVAVAGFAVCLADTIGGVFALVMPPLVGLLYA
ncbi:hypothetical protein GCM10027515_30400 [Schumannella luteola]|uniref:Uncharacterized protein n=1 Tax=Schumannella luteola TaxID=472059 RepID=A0A852YN60_9MICO|nr:hypothetical protein [Schumannella luteola]NYG99159.1 hypothetical protein [Schumannella luteola]